MGSPEVMRFLAMLVHKGLVTPAAVREALAHGADPLAGLVARGACTQAQIDDWQRTEGGDKPELKRYELLELLGEGGTARVWKARDKTTGSVLALKILRPGLAKDPKAVAKFVAESKLLIEIDSPQIVKGTRIAREGEVYFCAMDFIAGECLQTTLERQGRIDQEAALHIVAEVGKALETLHALGLVHRDIKPGNVLCQEGGVVTLIDLGFAVHEGEVGGDTTAGTVHYIAPEQARAESGLDARADIYALGATLYHLVTGSLPFEGGSSDEVMRKQVLEALSGDKIRALGLAPQVHYFVEKMMAKEKEIRFQSPREIVTEIEAYLQRRKLERSAEVSDEPERKKRKIRFR